MGLSSLKKDFFCIANQKDSSVDLYNGKDVEVNLEKLEIAENKKHREPREPREKIDLFAEQFQYPNNTLVYYSWGLGSE